MYKILITTRHSTMHGVAIHTTVAEFETKESADLAVECIRLRKECGADYQTVIKLYEKETR